MTVPPELEWGDGARGAARPAVRASTSALLAAIRGGITYETMRQQDVRARMTLARPS